MPAASEYRGTLNHVCCLSFVKTPSAQRIVEEAADMIDRELEQVEGEPEARFPCSLSTSNKLTDMVAAPRCALSSRRLWLASLTAGYLALASGADPGPRRSVGFDLPRTGSYDLVLFHAVVPDFGRFTGESVV